MSTHRTYVSPPCLAAEMDPAYSDPNADAPKDVARWRRDTRGQLRTARDTLRVAERDTISHALQTHLRTLLTQRFGSVRGRIISFYWPIKAEPDLRPLMAALHEEGAVIALPLVEQKAAPLVFRHWTPQTRMQRGDWNIPVPPPEADRLTPAITLAPLVGWDDDGYRLGYGGGYFDRTLAAVSPRPFTIGIGYQAARLTTIHPQPHDIPLDLILTEAGIATERTAPQ
ncbi:5-formyltetrahydrofolate cyclo-ligase [Roseovarius tolerans]|uniref:5-formyltetrahydrofolate cyclo-ligase n=1 Tax=Roseovarius tolerans TaxID=74031 RepID=A0A1H8H847_9RHOB|nr:5-formyltetrahydrofolate cyclo-ligase [Roseovarius tolerans]SEN52210.1 5-formyltetrahydrofolate cyclo-ligase [Roseovarius tolerans]